MRCYCCSSLPFKECCEPFIKGDKKPSSAEQLMRSRFSAYATEHYQYILDTYTKKKQSDLTIESLAHSAKGAIWVALQVHPAPSSTSDALSVESAADLSITLDTVEFTAYYFENKHLFQLHETSNFIKEGEQWQYHDGVLHDDCGKVKYGRNLPCVCGSNKKFKQCCATKNR